MGRAPCCSKVGLHRGPWTAKEDALLTGFIRTHGEGNWRSLPKRAGLLRCGKSCRLRWMNYLRPDIKRGNINQDEEDLIIRLHSLLGNRWSLIAGRLPGRTDNEIKNYWNSHLSKKLRSQGIEVTMKPQSRRRSKATEGDDEHTKSKKDHRRRKKKNNKNSSAAAEEVDVAAPRTEIHAPKPTRFRPAPASSTAMDSSSPDRKIDPGDKDDICWPDFSQHDHQAGLLFDYDFSYNEDGLFENVYQQYSQLLSLDDNQMPPIPLSESLFVQ